MKIMVGYEGSNACRAALKVAVQHAKAFGATLYVVVSMEKGSEDEQEQIKKTETELDRIREDVIGQGIPCETHLLIRGMLPGEDLIGYSQENDIDEIVIGIQRRSKMGKLLFGSTAQYVILSADCPVVTVK